MKKLGDIAPVKPNIDVDKLVKLLVKNDKAISTIPVETFYTVKNNSGEEVDISYVKASLMAFAKDKVTGVCPLADNIVADFDKVSFELFAKDLFNFYIEGAIDAKLKWIFYYSSIYGSDIVVDLYNQAIPYLTEKGRHALAVDCVKALVLNSSQRALVIVEEMSRKSKQRSIKNAAKDALKFMADELNITQDELADMIIPTFGFDTKNELIFDYGSRSFTVYLNSNLEPEIKDEKGKILKSIPKVGVNDNKEIAEKSSTELKAMKKQIKATVKTQTERLELAISSGRTWSYDNFFRVFVQNPLMNKFAISLVWGVYVEGGLTQTFRYMDDGSFNTHDEEEFTLSSDMIIGLVHPIELEENIFTQWKQQLEDYEITQPIEQIYRTVFYPKKEDLCNEKIEFDEGVFYSGTSLKSKLIKAGWEAGEVIDNGAIYDFHYHDVTNNITVELYFSGVSVVYYDADDDECNLYKLLFKNKENQPIKICDVPVKIISEFYNALSKVVVR